ncbi:MAG: hypothetical protein ACO3DY_05145 [Candidatus Nanopelagicaceae bacterium]
MSNQENLDRVSVIKLKVNEIGLIPLEEHGAEFEEVNKDLSDALASVEGIASSQS